MEYNIKSKQGKTEMKIRNKKRGPDLLVLVVIERMWGSARGQPRFPKQAGSVLSDPLVAVLSKLHFPIKFPTYQRLPNTLKKW